MVAKSESGDRHENGNRGCECSTCKIQMEQGTTKPTIHPIKILAMAYGLMPELENLFNRRSGELVIS